MAGMLRALSMIQDARIASSANPVIVDLHPDRPDYRGMGFGAEVVSMEADPTFDEVRGRGGIVDLHTEAHTVLDDMFLISGEIPRTTPYERGLANGWRYHGEEQAWKPDVLMLDERFMVCNVKGD